MRNPTNRRSFIKNATKATLAVAATSSFLPANSFANFNNNNWWQQQPLPYAYNALEPYIDAATMEIHYSKHATAYAKNLQDAIAAEKVDTSNGIIALMQHISKYSTKMRNNGGGHFNHEFFWKSMMPNQSTMSANMDTAIEKHFGSIEAFTTQFANAAKNQFGSGWAWLVKTTEGKLVISSTPNQDNPLMDVAAVKGTPLLGIDVWEHAYYLKYQNKRADYIEAFFKVINWAVVEQRMVG
jgi:superoxide dismutase, Fe-Mn family